MERAKVNFLIAAELGHVSAIFLMGEMLDEDDPLRFVWFGRAAASGDSFSFLTQMSNQMPKFSAGTGHGKVVFVIGRALKGQVDNVKRTIFGKDYKFSTYISPSIQALHFYDFQLRSYRKAVDSWTIVGLRNKIVKDIRKLIGKMIWDAREDAEYLERK
jgi:hypothetical protein